MKAVMSKRMYVYVNCQVSRGFWDNEFYVVVGNVAAYVQRDTLQLEESPGPDKEVPGKVRAFLLEQEPDKALIELPGEPVIGGLRNRVPVNCIAAA